MKIRFLLPTILLLFLSQSLFAKTADELIAKGTAFLRNAQSEDGSFSSHVGIGPSILVLTGLIRSGTDIDDPMLQKGMDYLLKHVRPDGGIYTEGGMLQNYETCVAVMCFAAANDAIEAKHGKEARDKSPYTQLLKKADRFIRNEQFTEDKGTKLEDPFYGGAGYGQHRRPDLSNTQFFLDALKAAGAKEDDPAIQKALVFVSRSQNLESEHNTLAFASKNPDGGFIYSSADQTSKAESPDGGLRSYGSMTYAGFKSLIYAGLSKDDKRYKAALDWLQKHYSLDENPGIGHQGLYYYYQTMAKTLSVLGADAFEAKDGSKHDWKADMIKALAEKQQPNGSWVNEKSDRWMEGDPNLVTAYVLLVLSDCRLNP